MCVCAIAQTKSKKQELITHRDEKIKSRQDGFLVLDGLIQVEHGNLLLHILQKGLQIPQLITHFHVCNATVKENYGGTHNA